MVTPAQRARLQRTHDNSGVLLLLEISHPSIDTAYVVNDTRNWVISGTTWVGLPFRFTLPTDSSSQSPAARIEIDNVGRALTPVLEGLPAGAALRATFRIVARATPAVTEWQFSAPMSGVRVTTTLVTAAVGTDDDDRMPAVMVRFDPSTTPGLFEG